jgi:hypothetical protein
MFGPFLFFVWSLFVFARELQLATWFSNFRPEQLAAGQSEDRVEGKGSTPCKLQPRPERDMNVRGWPG